MQSNPIPTWTVHAMGDWASILMAFREKGNPEPVAPKWYNQALDTRMLYDEEDPDAGVSCSLLQARPGPQRNC